MESYRVWWDYKKAKGTIRLYSKGDVFIKEGNVTFASAGEMMGFISVFLGRGAPLAFLPDSAQLEAGPFPVGRQLKNS